MRWTGFLCLIFCFGPAQSQVMVLGIAQDGGYPHAGCSKECCSRAWSGQNERRFVTSLALLDSASKEWYLFEATPDFREQLQLFDSLTNHLYPYLPSAICLTPAHIGHYTGLMHLGREVMGARQVPVYAMPRFCEFLRNNGPWSQLVSLQNIVLRKMEEFTSVDVSPGFQVTPVLVPHRDEYSETCGFSIQTKGNSYLFIPDIDKWEKWDAGFSEIISSHDVCFLDGTFSDSAELPGRSMSEIPHPLISETMELINKHEISSEVYFIHFNHTNRVMWDVEYKKSLKLNGIKISEQGATY